MAEMRVNGSRMHYVVDDFTPPWDEQKQTLYIQHGAGRTLRFWDAWVPRFAGRYRVIRRDMRGHGSSEIPPPGHDYSVDEWVVDTIGFIEKLGFGSVHYVGESIGGVVGIVAAGRYPEHFTSLTVTATPAAIGPARRGPLGVGTGSRLDEGGMESWVSDVLIPAGIISGGNSLAQRSWVVREYGRTPSHVLQDITCGSRSLDVVSEAVNVKVPTLVLAPARSPVTPLRDQIKLWEAIPGARLVVVDGPGHEIYVDRAEDCIAAVQALLDQTGAGAAP